jgi:alpha-tubulin suppressor-like RCC1 family protein
MFMSSAKRTEIPRYDARVAGGRNPNKWVSIYVRTDPLVKSLVSSPSRRCVIMYDDTVKCWGLDFTSLSNTIGDNPAEMGDNLLPINLGTGLKVKQICKMTDKGDHACAILTNGRIKCWGGNAAGQLGLGDTTLRGSATNLMGDNLPYVNIGLNQPDNTPLTVKQIECGQSFTCALMTNDKVKCWGRGTSGRLGIVSSQSIGDTPSEMGSSLAYVDLGTNKTAVSILVGDNFVCAILNPDNKVKCWGSNVGGKLGLSTVDNQIPSLVGQMGDNLPTVNLGAGLTAKSISAGSNHVCAILNNDQIKCWGSNDAGQLGSGNAQSKGTDPSHMGDNLLAVSLGSASVPSLISVLSYTSCVVFTDSQAKCWGDCYYATCNGNDESTTIGTSAGQMGEDLLPLPFATGEYALQLFVGYDIGCALLNSNKVKCWGDGSYGTLGYGDYVSYTGGPLNVTATVSLGTAMVDLTAAPTPAPTPSPTAAPTSGSTAAPTPSPTPSPTPYPCPQGTFSTGPAALQSSCTECPVGTYSNTSASLACLPCPNGTYANTTGRSSCRACSACAYAALAARFCNSTSDTVCKSGIFAYGTGTCSACPPGKFSSVIGST